MKVSECVPGTVVYYRPILFDDAPKFRGVVRELPWKLGSGHWVTHLSEMEAAYGNFVGVPGKTTVYAAYVEEALEEA